MTLPQTPSFRLDGKTALVAGASSGIGRGAAVALAMAGAQVVLMARSGDALQALADEITAAGGQARTVVLDITDTAALSDFLSQSEAFDILVNSAGLARHGPALDTLEADYDAALALNLKAAYFLSREVARGLMAAGRGGSLIHISSQMGHVGGPDRAVYCATKHALEGMTKAMALEWAAAGIRVNTLCPTFIRTPLAEQTLQNPERKAWILQNIRLGRLGEVEDLMGPVVFLASEASALMTGSHLVIDGGWTAA